MSLVSVTKISSLLLAFVAEQASLSLTWSETSEDTFSHDEAHMQDKSTNTRVAHRPARSSPSKGITIPNSTEETRLQCARYLGNTIAMCKVPRKHDYNVQGT